MANPNHLNGLFLKSLSILKVFYFIYSDATILVVRIILFSVLSARQGEERVELQLGNWTSRRFVMEYPEKANYG
jgi:hypothetical protein